MAKHTVLVVEDDSAMRRALSAELSDAGYNAVQADDGEVGLKQAFEIRPDLILLDIRMPKLNGLEVMAKLREDAWGKKVPIIILTVSELSDEMLKAVTKNEPSYYLVKSQWKLEEVIKKVREILEKKEK